jgi:SAM-dependent methyltransferase
MTTVVYHSRTDAARWSEFSHDYDRKVLSVTSFRAKRDKILEPLKAGVILDAGCGPMGLLLTEIARMPGTLAVGCDYCSTMIDESAQRTKGTGAAYVVGDLRQLPFRSSSIDSVVAVNSVLPEVRSEVDAIMREFARVLRSGGRLVAVLPAFEMSLVARDRWGMTVRLDVENRREWDTSGWQCFFTRDDIARLMHRYEFADYRVEKLKFDADDEIDHIRHIYAESLKSVPPERVIRYPLFEHLLIAER